jgi:hypothetical protein
MRAISIAFAVVLCVVRFRFDAHPLSAIGTYQAIAHIFVGILIGLWLASWRFRRVPSDFMSYSWAGYLAVVISLVEIVAAVIGRL